MSFCDHKKLEVNFDNLLDSGPPAVYTPPRENSRLRNIEPLERGDESVLFPFDYSQSIAERAEESGGTIYTFPREGDGLLRNPADIKDIAHTVNHELFVESTFNNESRG